MRQTISSILDTRTLEILRPRKGRVIVRIGRPRRSKRDWACQFQVTGIGDPRVRSIYGIDQLQAIMLTIDTVRVVLQNCGRKLSFLNGEEGDVGIPRLVPGYFGMLFSARLDHIIDQEVKNFARYAKKRHRAKK